MSAAGWQDVLAALLAAGALAWLVVRRVRSRRGKACEDCPAAHAAPGTRPALPPEPLFSIGEPSEPGRSPRP